MSIHAAGPNLNAPPNNNAAANNAPAQQSGQGNPAPAVPNAPPPANGGNGGNPPNPPTAPGNWRTDFHELHMLSSLGAGLAGPRYLGTHSSRAALLQVLGRGAFPGVATAALSRVLLGAQCDGGQVTYTTSVNGAGAGAFYLGITALACAGLGAMVKKEEREWELNHIPGLNNDQVENLRKALDKLTDVTDASLQAASSLVGVYVGFDQCATGNNPLIFTMLGTGLAVAIAIAINMSINANCWRPQGGGQPSINAVLRNPNIAANAAKRQVEPLIDEEIQDHWHMGYLSRGASVIGSGLAIGLAWQHIEAANEEGNIVSLNMIPGAVACQLLTQGVCDLSEKLRQAPKPFLILKGDWARANPNRMNAERKSVPNPPPAGQPNARGVWWSKTQKGVVALSALAVSGSIVGTYFTFNHSCDLAATSKGESSTNGTTTTTDYVTKTANVTVPTIVYSPTTFTVPETANTTTKTVPQTITVTVNQTNTETLTDTDSLPVTVTITATPPANTSTETVTVPVTITLPPATETEAETVTRNQTETGTETVTVPITITLPPSTETVTKNQTETAAETITVPLTLLSTIDAGSTVTDEEPTMLTVNVTVTPSRSPGNSSSAGNATLNRVPTTFNTSVTP